jgi:hypothetical protein
VGVSTTKRHRQLDAGATQCVVVKLIDRNTAIQAENEVVLSKVYFDNGPQTQQRVGRQPANDLATKQHRQLEVNAPRRAVVKLYNGNTANTAENEVKEPRFCYFMTISY